MDAVAQEPPPAVVLVSAGASHSVALLGESKSMLFLRRGISSNAVGLCFWVGIVWIALLTGGWVCARLP
jgi:hypothetical protein